MSHKGRQKKTSGLHVWRSGVCSVDQAHTWGLTRGPGFPTGRQVCRGDRSVKSDASSPKKFASIDANGGAKAHASAREAACCVGSQARTWGFNPRHGLSNGATSLPRRQVGEVRHVVRGEVCVNRRRRRCKSITRPRERGQVLRR